MGSGGYRQDDSIFTPSLGAGTINAMYVKSIPVAWIKAEFQRNGVNLSRQTMSNGVICCSEFYFQTMYEYLHQKQLSFHVTQYDEKPIMDSPIASIRKVTFKYSLKMEKFQWITIRQNSPFAPSVWERKTG
ncbi:IS66 family transposase [Lacrimispora algidixylanolytica]|uniref:Transposase IS66 central domain-containing protein n=1 Tax=Lacrimispora algidixylanolytica TaxID=94868 RepID=A0A419T2Q9_9FIRM|nr:transposase [Lacrimispora algidixylanolytica]RKD31742.1 hypothetical protein BET01_19675 [Lacrimispora algidixylanolytica]